MLNRVRVIEFVLLWTLVSSLPLSAEAQRRRPTQFRQQDPAPVLECRVFCSTEKLRTSVAELTWRSTEARLSTSRIEVTIYKDGFKNGNYSALVSSKGERSFRPSQAKQTHPLVPALSKLVVLEAKGLKERPGVVAVRIEGLEPGLNYFWRVVSTTNERLLAEGTAKCQAPTCPADMQPDNKR